MFSQLLLFCLVSGSLACPANITVSVVSPSSVNVSWYLNAPNTETCSVRAISSFATKNIFTQCTNLINSSAFFSQTVGDLCPRTNYTFSINSSETCSLQSEPFSINATAITAASVRNFAIVAGVNSSVDPGSTYRIFVIVSWSDPPPDSVLCNRTGYILTWRSSGVILESGNYSTAGQYILHNFNASTVYKFTVFLNTMGGPGDASQLTVTMPPDVPSAPTGPMISIINSTTLAFQWQPPVAPNTDSPLTYNVYFVRELGSFTNFVRETSNQQIQLAIFNPFERVCFRVSARNSQGEGLNTSEECSRTREAAPGPVSMLTYGRLTNTTIAVSWEAPQEPRGVITGYILTLFRDTILPNYQRLFKLENLVSFRRYEVNVRAVNGAGAGEIATLPFVYTDQDVPETVTNVRSRRLSGNSMVVYWSQPASTRGVTLGYEVTYIPKGSLSQIQNSVLHLVNTNLSIGGLNPNLAYDVRVRARSVAGYGPYSSTETVPVIPLPSSTPTNGSNILQLCLSGNIPCNNSDTSVLKKMVQRSLTSHLTGYCSCGTLVTDSTETKLLCSTEPRRIVFRAVLEERDEMAMLPTVKQWVSSPSPYLYVDDHALWVDSSCPLLVDSLSSSFGPTNCFSTTSSSAGALAGTFFAALILGILGTVGVGVLVVLILWRLGSDKNSTPPQTPVRYKKNKPSDQYEYLDVAEENTGANPSQDLHYEIPEAPPVSGQKKRKKPSYSGYRNIENVLPTATKKQARRPPRKGQLASQQEQRATASQSSVVELKEQTVSQNDDSNIYVMDSPVHPKNVAAPPKNVPTSPQNAPVPPQKVPAPPQKVPAPPQKVPAPHQNVAGPPPPPPPTAGPSNTVKKPLVPPKTGKDKPEQMVSAPAVNPKGKTLPTPKPKPVGKSTAGIKVKANSAYEHRAEWDPSSLHDVAMKVKSGAMKK